tara:strand:- start:411 stop:1151 length:741 start_codon:yes stop_codon:yes gene_type:complete
MILSDNTGNPIIPFTLFNFIITLELKKADTYTLSMITIALAKGALLKDSILTFKKAGLDFSEALLVENRSLTIESKCKSAKALLVRNGDVPVYVNYGQADLGIVGFDVLQETDLEVAKLLDLGFGGCYMSLAVKKDSIYKKTTDLPPNCKVASKFVNTARNYFDTFNLPVDIVHLTGSVELGPITGMAEAIVDLVATGKTLKENGLIKIDDIYYSTARLIANPLSLRVDNKALRELVLLIESSIEI